MQRTQWDAGYLPPSAYSINKAALDLGVDTRSVEAVRDLTALIAGTGKPMSALDLQREVQETARSRPLKATESGLYLVRETGKTFANAREAIAHQEKSLFDYHVGMRDFMVQAARKPVVQGYTPMETALYTFKAMKESLPSWDLSMESENPEMSMWGQMMQSMMPQQALAEMNHRFDAMKSLDQWERTMLLGSNLYREAGDKTVEVNPEDPENQIELAKVLNSDMRRALRVSRDLRVLSGLNNPSFQRWQSKPDGDETAYRRMKSLGEIACLRSSAYAYHKLQPRLFKHKMLNREFTVREHGIQRDNKQLLYVLIDGSGSMDGTRVAMATGVLLNRLRSVVKGDAQLWYAMFDDSPREERAALTGDEAITAVKYVLDGCIYSGGGTNINRAIMYAKEQIEKKMAEDPNLVQPEIMLVSDGEDSVTIDREELNGIRLHAVMCHCGAQTEVRKLATSTRGIYTHVD